MNRYRLINQLYRGLVRPIAFAQEAEPVHRRFTVLGERLGEHPHWLRPLRYTDPSLKQRLLGIEFANPIGLAAGFDYDGHLAATMGLIGFGFNTVGTVTAQAYGGNPSPQLKRLIKSRSILVNKGFKSEGAMAVAARLDRKQLNNHPVGISVGSSNVPSINTIKRAIDDYLTTLEVFRKKDYVKYFELNISCPNTTLSEPFTQPANFSKLVTALSKLKLSQPIFVKMPNELNEPTGYRLIEIALEHDIKGFIFGNLVKNRQRPEFDSAEIAAVSHLKGNFSGQPTQANAIRWLQLARQRYQSKIVLVGCGGTFNAADAQAKFAAGADLIQLITGLIFTGPALAGEINYDSRLSRTTQHLI